MKKTDNELIKQSRLLIMGVAAIWIMLFHSTIEIPLKGITFFNKIGYLGVDIFMFMSGFSMHHSFTKTCNRNSKIFIKKRIARIVPIFIPFALLWWVGYILKNYPTKELLVGAMHTKDFWITMLIFRWFIPCICFCYIITPLINLVINKIGHTYKSLFILIIPAIILSFLFLGRSSVALMILLRIPEYVIGYYYAGDKEKRTNVYYRMFILLAGVLVYYCLLKEYSDIFLNEYGLYWYPAIFLTSSMVICLGKIFTAIKSRIITFIGEKSLEVYLWHFYILFPVEDFLKNREIQFDKYNIIVNLLVIALTLIVALIYSKLINKIMSLYKKKRKRHVENCG